MLAQIGCVLDQVVLGGTERVAIEGLNIDLVLRPLAKCESLAEAYDISKMLAVDKRGV